MKREDYLRLKELRGVKCNVPTLDEIREVLGQYDDYTIERLAHFNGCSYSGYVQPLESVEHIRTIQTEEELERIRDKKRKFYREKYRNKIKQTRQIDERARLNKLEREEAIKEKYRNKALMLISRYKRISIDEAYKLLKIAELNYARTDKGK